MESVDPSLASLRVNGCYLWFIVLQIVLTGALLGAVLKGQMELISFIQIWVCFFLALDMYYSEAKGVFFSRWHNWIDIAIFPFIITSLGLEFVFEEQLHYDGDILAATVMEMRLAVQTFRLVCLFHKSKGAIEMSRHEGVSFERVSTFQNDQSGIQQNAQNSIASPRQVGI